MDYSKILLSATYIAVLAGCNSGSDDGYAEEPTAEIQYFPVQSVVPTTFEAGESGSILVAESGLSLYFFADDEQGVSNCNAETDAPAGGFTDASSCAGRWPPLLVDDGVTIELPYSAIVREDGTSQWAYNGYPLYQFGQDTSQGDVLGDGLGDVWNLARTAPINNNDDTLLTARNTVLSASNIAGELELQRLEKQGFSLYTFDNDGIDTANCLELGNGGCINAWPPVLADGGAKPSGLYGVATQENGVDQWTFRGKPLYLFGNDIEAGDTNGQGAGGVWYLATKEPAIQRDINGSSWLTATGQVYTLSPDGNGTLAVLSEDKDQFSLYTFANDEPGISNCTDNCLANWPAFLATEYDQAYGVFGIIERDDGNMQWTYEDQPLYFFVNDLAIDDINGHGIGDAFFLVSPESTNVVAEASPLGNTLKLEGWATTLQVDESDEFVVVKEDNSGRQLYTFDSDDAGDSNCDSTGCIGNWPALLVKEGEEAEAPYSILTRDDGYQQWAINGKPLYMFTPDTEEGDQLGEGAGSVWYVARPAPIRLSSIENVGDIFVAHRLDIETGELNDVSKEGFTLYTFGNDVVDSGVSSCTGGCAGVWPPLYAQSPDQAFGEYTVIERNDSEDTITYQWAYAGQPLYFFSNDTAVGDINGDDLNTFSVISLD